MQIAIVGLARSGRTTVFNTLTRGHAETGGFGGMTLNVGVVKVPDVRLDRLAAIFRPKKIVHADVTYVDLPAPDRARRPTAGWGLRSFPPSTSRGCGTPMRCCTWSACSGTRPSRTRTEAWIRPETSSGSTWSSSSPTLR